MKYTYRRTAFSKTQSINLTDDTIHTYDENNLLTNSFSYHKIKSITLVYSPIKSARKLHQCIIKTKNNKEFIIRSYSYISLANFKDQTQDYLAILKLLHEKTRTIEGIQFNKGINKTGYWALLIFLIIALIGMGVLAVALFIKKKYSEMGTFIFATVLFTFMVRVYIVSFKPEPYDPNNISKDALPFDF